VVGTEVEEVGAEVVVEAEVEAGASVSACMARNRECGNCGVRGMGVRLPEKCRQNVLAPMPLRRTGRTERARMRARRQRMISVSVTRRRMKRRNVET
jgi:hypothetical protein